MIQSDQSAQILANNYKLTKDSRFIHESISFRFQKCQTSQLAKTKFHEFNGEYVKAKYSSNDWDVLSSWILPNTSVRNLIIKE